MHSSRNGTIVIMEKIQQKITPEFPNCFVCGQENPKGLQRKFILQNGKSQTKFIGDKSHMGYENIVHGGIISALLDDAIIWASYAFMGSFGVTAELTVRFIKPVPINKKFIINGEILEDKGRLWIGSGCMKDESGNVYAAAKARIIPIKKIKNLYKQ